MAEVLSQSQIDELLKSVASGGAEPQKPTLEVEEGPFKKERKYDFHAPKKFTKDHLKLLDSVYTNFSRVLSSYLSGMLQIPCEVTLMDIEEQKYMEFNNAIGETEVVSLADVAIANHNDPPEVAMIKFSNMAIFDMLDRLMGGTGDVEDFEEDQQLTDIELSLLENLNGHIIPLMNEAWQHYFNASFSFNRVEVNPRVMQIFSGEDTVVIAVFNLMINETMGTISICLPGNTMETLFRAFDEGKNITKRVDSATESAANETLTNLSATTLDVKVVLGDVEVKLSDMYYLQVGDVINLNKPQQSEVFVYVEERPWFTANLGMYNKNIAVRLNDYLNL